VSAREVYTHGHHESVLRSHRWRTAENSAGYLLSHLAADARLLDVGCGPGTITADFALRIPRGEVVGLDRSGEVVALAAAEHAHPNLRFATGDVYALEFDDESFDVVHAHQLLQHLTRPVDALGEMRRVLRPGGLLAVRDADYGGFFWAPPDPVLDRWLDAYHALARRNGAEPDGGRHLPAWVRAAGFAGAAVSSSTWTFAAPEERAWWGGLWAERVTRSDVARQLVDYAISDADELATFAEAFDRWAADPAGVFIVPSVEVLARR
jgi:SAM-dependent methyltransferase